MIPAVVCEKKAHEPIESQISTNEPLTEVSLDGIYLASGHGNHPIRSKSVFFFCLSISDHATLH